MANSLIVKSNPARSVLNTVINKARRGVSKRDLKIVAVELGAYEGAFECDVNLIVSAIDENPRKTLVEGLEEVFAWFWKMDEIAAKGC